MEKKKSKLTAVRMIRDYREMLKRLDIPMSKRHFRSDIRQLLEGREE